MSDRHTRQIELILFFGGLLVGLCQSFYPDFGFGPGHEMVSIARSIVRSGMFGDPFYPHLTGPTASNPPLYPIFLATLIKTCGPSFIQVATLVNILLNALSAALLPRLSRVMFGDAASGIFAGVLWIFSMRLMPQWDTTATMTAILLFYLLAAHEVEHYKSGLRSGVIGGAACQLNPAAGLILFPWVLYVLWSRRIPIRRACAFVAILTATIAACILPWVARNYSVWHTPVLRTNLGYTVYASNNDCAHPGILATIRSGCYGRNHPVAGGTETQLLQSLGEVRYDRLRFRETIGWVRSHPKRFAQLTGARIWQFWLPDPEQTPRTTYAIWVITALSFPGMLVMARRREPGTRYIIAVWLLYPLMYYVVVSSDRYRFPLLWSSLLPAGYLLARLSSQLRSAKGVSPSGH